MLKQYGITGNNSFQGFLTPAKTKDGKQYEIQQVSDLIRVAEQVAGKAHSFKHI
jgi:hypothetical protein